MKLARMLAALAVFGGTAGWCAAGNNDPLDTPARPSVLAQRRLITSLARAGEHTVVAAGQRGHVLRSTDGGKTWAQARVPVSSDLTALQFVNERVGYGVGHDGVVLRSDDGGASWVRVLDGRAANQLTLQAMQRKVEAAGAKAEDEDRKLLAEAQRNVDSGPDKPFLDLWFTSADEGFVVGAYNLIMRTADGGKSWQSWYDRVDNPKLLNLYAIRPAAGTLVVVGEAGLLLKLDAAAQRFRALPSPYRGSFFGVLGTSAGVLAFGMRGNAFLSRDAGQSWSAVATGMSASITAGDRGADGGIVLVDQAGLVALSRDGGESFSRLTTQPPMPLSAVLLLQGGAVLGGVRGLRSVDLSKDRP